MSETTTALRAAENKVTLVGILRKKEAKFARNDKGVETINLSCTIETGENSEHDVRIYCARLKADGTPNGWYSGLVTAVNEYRSMADLMQQGMGETEAREQADRVKIVNGSLEAYERFDQQGTFRSTPSIRANTLNRVNKEDCTPEARVEVEMYISKIRPEARGGEPTGRLIVEGIVPVYQGAVRPFEFVVDESNAAVIQDNFSVGQTSKFMAELVNTVTNVREEIKGMMGTEIRNKTTYVHELKIVNCMPPYPMESKLAYQPADIREALRVREEEYIPSLRNRRNKPAANRAGFSTPAMSGMPGFNAPGAMPNNGFAVPASPMSSASFSLSDL